MIDLPTDSDNRRVLLHRWLGKRPVLLVSRWASDSNAGRLEKEEDHELELSLLSTKQTV